MQYTGQLAMFDLRKQLMEHLQRLDLAFYDRNPVGRLVTRVTTDVDVLNDLFASGLVTILGDVLVLAFIVAIMFRLSPPLTAIMLAAMPLVVAGDRGVPAQRDAKLPPHPRGHRQDQRLPAGAHHRHRGAAAFQPRAAQRRRNSTASTASTWTPTRTPSGLRLVLPGGGVHLHAGAGGDSDLRRISRARAAR